MFEIIRYVYLRIVFAAMSMATHITKVLSYIITNVSDAVIDQKTGATSLSCYSCMSPWYAAKIKGFDASDEVDMWKTNSMHFYHKPDRFTKYCDEETFDAKMLKTKNCTDTCIYLSMDNAVLGRTYRTYMRGCLADLINHNRSITRFLTYQTKCTTVALKYLFNGDYRPIEQPEQKVKLCACHSHKCNGAGRSSAIELFELHVYNGLLTLGVLFVYTINKWL